MSDRLKFCMGRSGNGKPSIIIDDEIVSPDKIVEALDQLSHTKARLEEAERIICAYSNLLYINDREELEAIDKRANEWITNQNTDKE